MIKEETDGEFIWTTGQHDKVHLLFDPFPGGCCVCACVLATSPSAPTVPNIGGVTVRLYEARLWWEYGGVQYNTEIHVYSTLCPQ